MIMNKKCALTGVECKPVESHIIPKFMFYYLKKNNGGLPFYWADNPMSEMKDGWKVELLSQNSDNNEFGKWEKWSKKHIFDKVWQGRSLHIDTNGPYLYNFIFSLFWRILTVEISHIEEISDKEAFGFFEEKQENWRRFLSSEDNTTPKDRVFFMPINMNAIGERETTWAEKEWIRDEIGFGFYNEGINFAMYIKCPKCLFWCILQGDFPNTYLGQEIHHTGDIIDLDDYILQDNMMLSFVTERIAKSKEKRVLGYNKLSDGRKEKMANYFLNDTFVKSESGQIILHRILEEDLEDMIREKSYITK